MAGFDQVFGGAVHEVEVVAGLVEVGVAGAPFQSKPSHLHGVDDGVDVFGVFFFGVGVVKAQVAHAAVVARQAKVQADALGVADVQVAVGLGRKAGADLGGVGLAGGVVGGVARAAAPAAAGVGAFGQVVLDDLAQEVAGLDGFGAEAGDFSVELMRLILDGGRLSQVICAVFVGFEFGDGDASAQPEQHFARCADAHGAHAVERQHLFVARDEVIAARQLRISQNPAIVCVFAGHGGVGGRGEGVFVAKSSDGGLGIKG